MKNATLVFADRGKNFRQGERAWQDRGLHLFLKEWFELSRRGFFMATL
jgi:hypothetical protein